MHDFLMGIWGWFTANPLVGLGVAAVVAFLFMASGRATTPEDMKGLRTSGR